MKRIVMFYLGAICLAGCASIHRTQATSDAIDKGLIDGLSASNHFSAYVWSFPSNPPVGPYTKVSELTGCTTTKGVAGSQTYVFYLGKSRETSRWEVFSCMLSRNGKWEPVTVKLPQF